MKRIAILLIALLPILACNSSAEKESNTENEGEEMHEDHNETGMQEMEEGEESASLPSTGNFGAEITTDGAITPAEMMAMLADKDSVEVKVKGIAGAVCQRKGCWMTMPVGDGEMRITFRDYGFFVPKDASGKEVIIQGIAKKEVTGVEELRHYAEDAGESEEAIAAITEPEEDIVFVADGVIIREPEQ